MTDENAALAEDETVTETVATDEVTESTTAPVESAPQPESTPAESQGYQKRINKIVAQRGQAERERDAVQKELDDLRSNQVIAKPSLESFDFDEDKHRSALIQHEVSQAINSQNQKLQESNLKASHKVMVDDFQSKGEEFAKTNPKYWENLNAIPTLEAETLGTLMRHENGIELANYLGEHLDVASELSSMTPFDAAVKIGVLSTQLSQPKVIEPSAAPDPIEPITTGGSLSGDEWSKIGEGATFE